MAVYTAIDDAGSFYSTKIYTGTGSSLAVTGVGFQPDFTWIKNRDTTDANILTNAVRGATKYQVSETTAAEVTDTETLKSFDSGGFTVGTTAEVNTSTEDYVSWNWKAGTTTGIDTTGSTITPTAYSINATAGFSIITYAGNGVSGATVPHGLGVVPKMIIVKSTNDTYLWSVYHSYMDATYNSGPTAPEDWYLILNTAVSKVDNVAWWNDTAPTSTVFSLGDDNVVNNGDPDYYIAYCFTDVQGFSKFGSYIGNGNSKGPFVYTGFRPAFILTKKSSGGLNWGIHDNKREGYNKLNDTLYANVTDAEAANTALDILSNGFKIRTTDTWINENNETYIYMAFAEAPLVNSSSVPVNAR